MAGLIHLYVGDGKGKTTAAAGLALRALGTGRKVLFGQFLKGRPTGEIAPLEGLGAKILRAEAGEKFVFQMTAEEKAQSARQHGAELEEIRREMLSGGYDLLVLDEVVDAVNCGVVALQELLQLIEDKPAAAELVLTGRNPPQELVDRCDYHTEFVCKRHPYQKGIGAREGIEY